MSIRANDMASEKYAQNVIKLWNGVIPAAL